MSSGELDAYKVLRKNGCSEEQALDSMESVLHVIHPEPKEPEITNKDLKIAILELKEYITEKFHTFAKEYKLEWMNIKINFILWIIGIGVPSSFGYLLYKIDKMNDLILQIILKLPK